jgi:hypothetical protein
MIYFLSLQEKSPQSKLFNQINNRPIIIYLLIFFFNYNVLIIHPQIALSNAQINYLKGE